MRWIRRAAVVAAFAAAVGMARNAARADGSSPPRAPTGTIYFQDLSTLDAATNTVVLCSMDPEGGNRTAVLRTDRYVRPSRVLHGPARWFLTMKTIEGAEIGGNPRRDVFAVRDDGAEVRLTSDPTTEYWMPDWAFSDAFVSLLGRRWTSTAPDATVVPRTAGLYLLDVLFDEDGSGIETVRAPVLWTLFFDATVGDREGRDSAAYFSSLWGDTPDVAAYSWSPDGILAVQDLDARTPRIRILDFSVGDEGFDPSQRWEGQDPSCAPDASGLRIAYARFVPAEGTGTDTWVIETADYSRSDRFTTEACVPHPASAATTHSLGRPSFAPDGSDIAYQLQRNGKGTTNYILREPGLGPKNLTPGVKPAAAGETGMVLVDWR
jgi:hypothetical protein